MKHTYKVVSAKPASLERYLNAMGAEGWALASVIPTSDLGTTDGYVVVMERGS